jgi:ADP-ribosylglycohydrolase
MLLAVADAVVRQGKVDGRAAAQHLSWLWQEGTILQPRPTTTQAVEALLAGAPWMSAGAALGVKDASCLSRGVVAGLVSEPAPPRLAHHAQVLTVMTHKDPACAAAVAVVGRAVQLGLEGTLLDPQAFCEALAQAAAPADPELADEVFYLPRVLSWEPQRALAALRRVGVPVGEYDLEHGLPPHVVPVLLTAVFAALHAPADFRAATALVLSGGGEVDVATGLVGAFLGASLGTAGLPPRLARHVLYAEALVHTADQLFGLTEIWTPALAPARVRTRG